MFGDVTLGAEEALFFAGPQCDADGAAGMEVEGFDDADGFHHGRAAGGVVGCAGAGVPGIHVSAEHDDFILQIGSGNFGDGVVAHLVVVEFHFQLDGHFQFLAGLNHPHEAVEMLGGERFAGGPVERSYPRCA